MKLPQLIVKKMYCKFLKFACLTIQIRHYLIKYVQFCIYFWQIDLKI